jgi:hypothetical protein
VSLRGVVEDLSGLRDRGPGFKTINIHEHSIEFRHAKDDKTLELRVMN